MQGNIIGIRGTGNLDSLFCFRPLSVETPKHDLGASQNWGAYENQALKTKFDVGGGGGGEGECGKGSQHCSERIYPLPSECQLSRCELYLRVLK